MGNVMLKNIQSVIEAFYDHFLYFSDMLMVYSHVELVLDRMNDEDDGVNFFKITKAATVDSMMMCIARLLENGGDVRSIFWLIKKCRSNKHLSKNGDELEKKLNDYELKLKEDNELEETIQIIKLRRDKIFAHNDGKFFVDPKNDTSYLPSCKLWALQGYIQELLCMLTEEFDCNNNMQPIYDGDLNKLLPEDTRCGYWRPNMHKGLK
ncbi:MAG: hypothetical protein IKB07_01570 [Lachnospiraceae bacterium]|nr:hypothetical protein [Lachnospiraceae bacterium]